jgi:hypothetical protein
LVWMADVKNVFEVADKFLFAFSVFVRGCKA